MLSLASINASLMKGPPKREFVKYILKFWISNIAGRSLLNSFWKIPGLCVKLLMLPSFIIYYLDLFWLYQFLTPHCTNSQSQEQWCRCCSRFGETLGHWEWDGRRVLTTPICEASFHRVSIGRGKLSVGSAEIYLSSEMCEKYHIGRDLAQLRDELKISDRN